MKSLSHGNLPSAALLSALITISSTALTSHAQTALETFEYDSVDTLTAAWTPTANAVLTLSPSVAATSDGTKSLAIQFSFPSVEWATESVKGPELPAPVSIASTQFVTFRVKGDPAFEAADFRNLYLYAYDDAGNFGRWGAPVPTTSDWQIRNHLASAMEKPWDSPALPDLTHIVRFAFFQYGSQAAIGEYTATVQVDDLTVRDTPLSDTPTTAETVVEAFEYPGIDELATAWIASVNTVLSTSDNVALRSPGKTSMKAEFNFPSSEWATESVKGPELAQPLAISPAQYLTFRLRGDPAFAAADFRNLYLYAYDDAGGFGRWGTEVPTTSDWKILNFAASAMEKPWDSPNLPDLARIVRFAFFQYGSQAALDPYTASIQIDDLMVRNTPLTEFPAPSPARTVIDDFESYANNAALLAAYGYLNSPATTATTASLVTPAPQGNQALRLAIDFAAGQYPWGSIRSVVGTPFSLPTNAVVTLRFKGDPALASVADDGTSFWLSFYDQGGRGMNFITSAAPVASGEWTTLEARFQDFGDSATVDTGNLVRWRILVQGWTGTAESAALSGSFEIDDVRVTTAVAVPPTLAIARDGTALSVNLGALTTGKSYDLLTSTDLVQWTSAATIQATGATSTWKIAAPVAHAFFRVVQKP